MKKNTRDNILDATLQLLWEQSYGSVSVDDICHAAKVQKGSFYHYFPSKVDVVIEAFEKMWQCNRAFYDNIFSSSLSPLERLEKFCEEGYLKQKEKAEKLGKVLGCPCMSCGSELSTQDERIRQKMDEIFSRSAKYFETLLHDAKAQGLASMSSPATAAQEMQSYAMGVLYQAKIKNDVEIIRRDLLPGLLRFFDIDKTKTKVLADRLVKQHETVA